MVVDPKAKESAPFELKSAALTLVAVLLRTTDLALLSQAFDARFGDAPELFDQDPVAIDLSAVSDATEPIDFAALIALLRRHKMQPIGAKGGSAPQMEAALAAGLAEAHGHAPARAEAAAVTAAPGAAPEPTAPRTALVVDKPLRSGQRVYAKGADLIVLAVVSFGAEVIADGHIHVYAPLRGRALAGALGDTTARIFTTCMQAQLLSIAGIYRTTETELPASVLGKPAQVRLDGEKLVVEALSH
jgi:septum site-determining protein MinC